MASRDGTGIRVTRESSDTLIARLSLSCLRVLPRVWFIGSWFSGSMAAWRPSLSLRQRVLARLARRRLDRDVATLLEVGARVGHLAELHAHFGPLLPRVLQVLALGHVDVDGIGERRFGGGE